MRQKSPAELDRLSVKEAQAAARMPLTFVLENVRSGNNVGSVLRTADAFALAEVVLVGITPQPPHREILKTSLGAEESVPWRSFGDMPSCLIALRQNGTQIFALEQTTHSRAVDTVRFGEIGAQKSENAMAAGLAIVLGNEVRGVSATTLAAMDGAVEIEQFGMKHSLNVSVAAGIVAYALRMQWDNRQHT